MQAKFISKARLTKQGQITLPLEARKDLDIDIGSELYWYEIGDKLIIVKDLTSPNDLIKNLKKEVK